MLWQKKDLVSWRLDLKNISQNTAQRGKEIKSMKDRLKGIVRTHEKSNICQIGV